MWSWSVCVGEDVFVSCKEVKNEALSVGGLAGWEVLSECVLGEGEKLVVSFALAVSLCSSFLLFRRFEWFFLFSEDSHVAQCVGVGSDGRVENVQWCTVFCMKRWLESFGQDV